MYPASTIGYLLHHLAFVLSRQSDEALQKQLGIGFSQFKILMCLGEGGVIRQRLIADNLGQTEASVSRQIKLLHDKGLLSSTVKPTNRREHRTQLTAKGRRTVSDAFAILNEYHQPLFEHLTPIQLENFQGILTAMHNNACSGGCKLKENALHRA